MSKTWGGHCGGGSRNGCSWGARLCGVGRAAAWGAQFAGEGSQGRERRGCATRPLQPPLLSRNHRPSGTLLSPPFGTYGAVPAVGRGKW